jgi:ABC-type multidrug transport system fused ATPase/permease subunit
VTCDPLKQIRLKDRSLGKSFAALFEIRSKARIALLAALLVGLALGEGTALFLLLGALTAFAGVESTGAGTLGKLAAAAGLPLVLAAFLVAALVVAVLQYVTRRETGAIRLDFLHQRRMALFDAVRRARWLALADKPASRLRYGFNLALQIVVACAMLAIGLAFALYTDARITLLMLVAGLVSVLPFRLAERHAVRLSTTESARDRELHERVDQSLADIKFLKFLGSHDSAANRVERDSRDQVAAMDRLFAGSAATGALYSLVSSMVIAFALLSAWMAGGEPGTLLMLAVIAGRLFPRVTTLVGSSRRLAELGARWREFDTLMDELRAVAEPAASTGTLPATVESIVIDRVAFSYLPSKNRVLGGISFRMERGKAIGLVGLTGAGKTTTVDLVSGLFSPDSGEIRLDQVRLDDRLRDAWRQRIALVDQDSVLLSATLRENLALRSPSATDAELAGACESVGLGPLVARLPEGLDTFLGDNGRLLSRGERQRVSIARALLQRPDLLILDEATASLNPLDEAALIAVIRERKHEFATLSVAHRVSALMWVDEVLVLTGGRIVEHGSPRELLADGQSLFYKMAFQTGVELMTTSAG